MTLGKRGKLIKLKYSDNGESKSRGGEASVEKSSDSTCSWYMIREGHAFRGSASWDLINRVLGAVGWDGRWTISRGNASSARVSWHCVIWFLSISTRAQPTVEKSETSGGVFRGFKETEGASCQQFRKCCLASTHRSITRWRRRAYLSRNKQNKPKNQYSNKK